MEGFSFREGTVSQADKFGFGLSLFNNPAHLRLQVPTGWRSFLLQKDKSGRIDGIVHFNIDGRIALSPFRSPFGSFEFSVGVPSGVMDAFIAFVEERLAEEHITEIHIKCSPLAYDPHAATLISTLLLNRGFRIERAEVGSLLSLSGTDWSPDTWEARKLRQAKDAGLQFCNLGLDKRDEVFRFISACREERGQEISITAAQLEEACNTFPDHYFLSGVSQDGELAAASVAVAVNKQVAYNFLSAHSRATDALSPVVLLMEGLYQTCRARGFSWLDLGTSALGDRPNFTLLDFKLRLGATLSPKFTFVKSSV